MSHFVGFGVHDPSMPLVIASSPLPLPKLLFQPRPCSCMEAPSGSRPTCSPAGAAPWHLPKVWPPAVSATVSSSFMAMRPKVSRMSRPDASTLGWPFGPSGLT